MVAGGSPDLKALRANPAFVSGLEAELTNPRFISGAVRQDLINGNHTYTTALLFTYDYVHLGPGFTPHLDGTFASAPSGTLLAKWLPTILVGLTDAQKATTLLTTAKATSLIQALTTASGTINPAVAMSRQVQALGFAVPVAEESGLNKLAGLDQGTWKSIADENKVLWSNTDNNWANAVVNVASVSTSTTEKVTNDAKDFGEGVLIGITAGLEDHQDWKTTTITGQAVASWIDQGNFKYPSYNNSTCPHLESFVWAGDMSADRIPSQVVSSSLRCLPRMLPAWWMSRLTAPMAR